ncbi:MAG: glycosyltransferase family 4 protein [Alphaproteobacteria bacterium]
MRVTFVNANTGHDYDVDSAFTAPLGGGEAAQCFLAVELARLGVEVHLLNGTRKASQVHGVTCLPLSRDTLDGIAARSDAVFLSNFPESIVGVLRDEIGYDARLLLWEQNFWIASNEAHRRTAAAMTHPRDTIICVSDWHRRDYMEVGGIDPSRVVVLRNAISPFFEGLFAPGESISACKAWPPVMAFTSVPYKGLTLAMDLLKPIRDTVTDVTLNIFSSFNLYAENNLLRNNQEWLDVCDRCRATLGANYIGVTPRPELARSLRGTSILFYPNVMPETSSIAVMEAMAAGCLILTSELAALPETLAGFGRAIPIVGNDDYPTMFYGETVNLLRFLRADPTFFEDHLQRQVAFVNSEYTFARRATEVVDLLARLKA